MKRIIICQSVVGANAVLVWQTLDPAPPPLLWEPFTLSPCFFSNLSLCSTKDDPKAEKASLLSFLLAFSIAQRSPSSSSASIFFYILTSQTVNTTPPEFLSSTTYGLYCMWNMLILQSERERKWSAFIVFNILTSQTTPAVNSQHHSSVLSSTSISSLSCLCV